MRSFDFDLIVNKKLILIVIKKFAVVAKSAMNYFSVMRYMKYFLYVVKNQS